MLCVCLVFFSGWWISEEVTQRAVDENHYGHTSHQPDIQNIINVNVELRAVMA